MLLERRDFEGLTSSDCMIVEVALGGSKVATSPPVPAERRRSKRFMKFRFFDLPLAWGTLPLELVEGGDDGRVEVAAMPSLSTTIFWVPFGGPGGVTGGCDRIEGKVQMLSSSLSVIGVTVT